MSNLFGGHIVAKYLKEIEQVEVVFSLSGGHIDRIYDGFLEYGVKLIDVRHEQAAAMMAHAWSVYNGNPGVCLVTAGHDSAFLHHGRHLHRYGPAAHAKGGGQLHCQSSGAYDCSDPSPRRSQW